MGEHAPPRGPDPTLFDRSLPAPVQFHPDARFARRRVPALASLLHVRRIEAVRAALDDEARRCWDLFWRELLPAAAAAADEGWPSVRELARIAHETHGGRLMNHLDRVRAAAATAVLEQLDPHLLGQARPRFAVTSYFHGALRANAILLGGEDACARALADEGVLLDRAGAASEERGLMLLTVFDPDTMVAHARKHRLLSVFSPPLPPPPEVLPGFPHVLPLLAASLPDPEERLPTVRQLPSGEWLLNGEQLLVGDSATHERAKQ